MAVSKWQTMESAPRTGEVIEARCGLYPPMDAYWTGWHFVFNDDEDGEIAYPFTHWKEKT